LKVPKMEIETVLRANDRSDANRCIR
jgi:hypothetical protein